MPASNDKWRLQNPLQKEVEEEPAAPPVTPPLPEPEITSWQPRFGLGSMMLVLLVVAMTAAGARYLIKAIDAGTSSRAIFVIFVLVIPVALLVVLNGIRLALKAFEAMQRRK